MRPALLAALGSLLLPAAASAQTVADSAGPRRGSWGEEVGFGDGTSVALTRFHSARSAWLLGLTFDGRIAREERPGTPLGDASASTEGWVDLTARAGMRRWRPRVTGAVYF